MRYWVLVKEPCTNKMVTVVADSETRMAAMEFAEAKTFGGMAIGVKENAPKTVYPHGTIHPADTFWQYGQLKDTQYE